MLVGPVTAGARGATRVAGATVRWTEIPGSARSVWRKSAQAILPLLREIVKCPDGPYLPIVERLTISRYSGVTVRNDDMAIIIEAIFEAIAWFVYRCLRPVFGTIFFYTGELTFILFTLGRHKLQPHPYKSGVNHANPRRSMALGGLVWFGLIVWYLIALFGLHIE